MKSLSFAANTSSRARSDFLVYGVVVLLVAMYALQQHHRDVLVRPTTAGRV